MEKKIFWKFNIIDILLLAIIIISLIALIYKITWGKSSGETRAYTFTYVCDSAPRTLAEQLQTGAACADGENGTELGQLISAEMEEIAIPTATAEATADLDEQNETDSSEPTSTPAPTTPPENVKVTLQSELEGKAVTHGVEVEDILYLKGKSLSLIVDQTLLNVYIADIEEHSAAAE